jgi:hypothetical protein
MASPWNNQTVKIQNRTISWALKHVAITVAAIAYKKGSLFMYNHYFK